jgi:hypothetical protein
MKNQENIRSKATPHRRAALGLLAVAAGLIFSQESPYRTGTWDADIWGNHRAVIRVQTEGGAVRVHIPWRRRDAAPEKKAVLVLDARTGKRVLNVAAGKIDRESGDFVFQPVSGPGDYFFYFLPYRLTGSRNYPNAKYLEPEGTVDPAWLARYGLAGPSDAEATAPASVLPEARVVEFQSIDDFSSFQPMEVIATAEETLALASRYAGEPFLLFPEDRRASIRMADDLPLKWIAPGPRSKFEGEAARGEFYVFQIGVWACKAAVEEMEVRFSDLKNAVGDTIPAAAFRCFNTGGVDWNGEPLKKTVGVPRGKIQALWCGVQVPVAGVPGTYEADITIGAQGPVSRTIRLALKVSNEILADGGDGDPARMSRLRWLDSTLAVDDENVKPFLPLSVKERTISGLGRNVTLGADGFPAAVRSFFSSDVTRLDEKSREVLAAPITFVIEAASGQRLEVKPEGLTFTKQSPGKIGWEFRNAAGSLRLDGRAWMEMDGYLEFRVKLSAASPLSLKDVRLEVPLASAAAKYMMGLGWKGGLRPAEFRWSWDRTKNQDALWIGDVNAGLQIGLRAENYSRPLNTNFYLSKPLLLPPSWWNDGRGGVTIQEAKPGVVILAATSGARTIEPGKDLWFNFTLLLTPFKPIDPKSQFATRFFHAFKPLDEAAKTGANTLNIHHANDINPYINYPFLRVPEVKSYIDDAHRRGLRVKIYNTIRELSNRAPEIFALRSLGTEIFSSGPGGGYSWLQEHLGSDYIAAWFVPQLKDAAVINSGMSRWHNYYIEGLDWLARNVGIDGLYLDDVAFDRTTMKRVRKVLDRNRPAALLDLHSANQYNPRDGFASSANLYLEHFPYLNRLWFGEYFDYQGSPADYWLVEVSGIPFGLMGEMLQDGGNPWRGMVFGMTNRLPWSGNDPSRLWKVWDEFGIGEARMIGWWAEDCPVKTDNPEVVATVFQKNGKSMVSLASWAKGPVKAGLKIDWKALGIDPRQARLRAPAIPDFQFAAEFSPDDPIPFEVGKGWILILE